MTQDDDSVPLVCRECDERCEDSKTFKSLAQADMVALGIPAFLVKEYCEDSDDCGEDDWRVMLEDEFIEDFSLWIQHR